MIHPTISTMLRYVIRPDLVPLKAGLGVGFPFADYKAIGAVAVGRHGDATSSPGGRGHLRKPALWIAGLVIAAVGTLVTSLVTGVAQNWLNLARVSDATSSEPAVQLVGAIDSGPRGWTTTDSLTLDKVAQEPVDYVARANWWHSLAATPLREESISATLEGTRADPVQVVDLSAHIDWCGEPTAGSLLYNPAEGTEDTPDLSIDFDKGDGRASENVAASDSTQPQLRSPYFDSHSISLARGEKVNVHITATALMPKLCRWRLEASEVVDGQTESQIFDQAFSVSGDLGSSKYASLFGSAGVLIKQPTPDTVQSHYYPADYSTFCEAVKRDGTSDCETLN